MSFLQELKFEFDKRFRKKRFDQVIADGLINELFYARAYTVAFLEREQEEKRVFEESWIGRDQLIRNYEDKFRSYGFKTPMEYIERDFDDDLHYDFLDWMEAIKSPDDKDDYLQIISTHEGEIESCKKVLADLDIIIPVVAKNTKASLETLLSLFKKHEVYYLLYCKSIISFDRIVDSHYFGNPRMDEEE